VKFSIDRNNWLLIVILAVVLMISISVTIYTLYQVSYNEQQQRLVETVKIQARLMEAVAVFDKQYSQFDILGGAEKATLSQISAAHEQYKSASNTGEFTLARLENNVIKFLLRHRNNALKSKKSPPKNIIMGSSYAVPMQLALSGQSGTIIANDYRGAEVLAAYEPVAILNYGIVAKIDIAEIKAPFIGAAIKSLLVGGILIIIGAAGFRFVTQPLIDRLTSREKQIRQLLNSTGEGIYGIDLDGKCTFANQSCLTILGYESVNELIGQNMHYLIHHHYHDGSSYPVEQCHIFKAFREGKGTTIDNEVLWRKDRSAFPAEYRSFPIFSDNEPIGAVVSFVDITERKEAEAKLFQSEETYKLAMEATQDGLWDWKITTGDVYYSPGWKKILGVSQLKYTSDRSKCLAF